MVFKIPGVCLQAFSSHPLPALLLAPFLARQLTLVPRFLHIDRTETLATQATYSCSTRDNACACSDYFKNSVACEQALCLGKNSEEREGKGGGESL